MLWICEVVWVPLFHAWLDVEPPMDNSPVVGHGFSIVGGGKSVRKTRKAGMHRDARERTRHSHNPSTTSCAPKLIQTIGEACQAKWTLPSEIDITTR